MNDKNRHNYQTDLSYIENFGREDDQGKFVAISIPDNIDFEIEYWADEVGGATFRVSRIGGQYDHCLKYDDTRIKVFIPLSRRFLGEGYLCRKLRVRFPGLGWQGEAVGICLPKQTEYYLWEGPSDTPDVTTQIEETFAGAFKGKDGISTNYYIQTRRKYSKTDLYDLHTVIENLTPDNIAAMADPDKFRLVLLRDLSKHGEGRRWRIPMLPYVQSARLGYDTPSGEHNIVETDTWWPVTGKVVPWFRNGRKLPEVISMRTRTPKSGGRVRFCTTCNLKMRVGVALMQFTGAGGEGWTRVSNISYITLFVSRTGTIIMTIIP